MRLQTKEREQTTDNHSVSVESNFYKFILTLLVGIALFVAAMCISPEEWITNVVLLIGIIITNVPEELMVCRYFVFFLGQPVNRA